MPLIRFSTLLVLLLLHLTTQLSILLTPEEKVLSKFQRSGLLQQYKQGNDDSFLHYGKREEMFLAGEENVYFDRDLINRRLKNSHTIINYLDNFGYIDKVLLSHRRQPGDENEEVGSMMSMSDVELALSLFQEMNSLPVTGEVSGQVLDLMRIPRCGVPDTYPNYFAPRVADKGPDRSYMARSYGGRSDAVSWASEGSVYDLTLSKRYVTSEDKWDQDKLAFYIENASVSLQEEVTRTEIFRALAVWAENVPLTFYEVIDPSIADISISFVEKYHGDKYPFDGPMGVLAHAFYPRNGNVHFDNEENFTAGSKTGVNFYYTAAHELGHTLGLKHSMKRESLMSPYHRGLMAQIHLHADDKEGITELYGAGKGSVHDRDTERAKVLAKEYREYLEQMATWNAPPPNGSSCISKIDATFRHPTAKALYFVVGDVYYELRRNKKKKMVVSLNYPRNLTDWKDLPSGLDGAVTDRKNGIVHFYKGNRTWKYQFEGKILLDVFPKKRPDYVPKNLQGISMDGDKTFYFSSTEGMHITRSDGQGEVKEDLIREDIQAGMSLFVSGYYAFISGNRYSIFRTKTHEPVRVYENRRLSWDYNLPMCEEASLMMDSSLAKKMVVLCEAYALLALTDMHIGIPEECYRIMEPFDVLPLEECGLD